MATKSRPLFTTFLLLRFLLFFSYSAQLHASSDTLSQGQSLSGNQTMVSKLGNFELGFFTPGNSHKYFIGIWYKKVSTQTVVWVANRERPVFNTSSSELKLSNDGNLVLTHSEAIIWSSNSTFTASNTTVAVLLDDGNLVLKGDSNSHASWQSFDHPTNTWLPGATLVYDKFSREGRLLTSWRNSEDPSPGLFSAEVSPGGAMHFSLLTNRSERYWPSGTLFFSGTPAMHSLYNFSYVAEVNTSYMTYVVQDSSVIANFVLDYTGQMKRWLWNNGTQQWLLHCIFPNDPCEVYALCGPFSSCSNDSSPSCECLQGFEPLSVEEWNLGDHTRGCARKAPLLCGERDGFVQLSNVQLPASPEPLAVGSAKECEATCSNNCSCVAYSFDDGCLMWKGEILNLKKLSDGLTGGGGSGVVHLRLAASELARSNYKKRWDWKCCVAILCSVAGFTLIASIVFVLVRRLSWNPDLRTSEAVHGVLVMFDYKVIRRATKDFSEMVGQGGFGAVFKGVLPDSTAIAVKKLHCLVQGEKQFRTELSSIGMIHHVNLARLRGFCSEGDKRLLVYDYVPRGSLDSHLFDDCSETLSWDQRFQIALGIARGLAYLHEECRECIIHCDIKPENILLDADMCPKIADFGMAKLFGHEFSRVLTTMRGTIGYLAPEWLTGSAVTPKADVYSYGLMLLEIISGRRNRHRSEDGKGVYFPLWAALKLNEGDILGLLDEKLEGNAKVEELNRACRTACWCIQDQESSRPTMGQVVQQLEGLSDVRMPPIPGLLQKLAMDESIICGNSEYLGTSVVSTESFSYSSSFKPFDGDWVSSRY